MEMDKLNDPNTVCEIHQVSDTTLGKELNKTTVL